MKLNYRYTLAYAIITLLVLSLGFVIVYAALTRSVTQATVAKLTHLNAVAAGQLRRAGRAARLPARVRVQLLPPTARPLPEPQAVVREEWDASLQATVQMVRLRTDAGAGGRQYRLTSQAAVVEPEGEQLVGIGLVFAWTFVFLLALVVILSEVISWYILRPFNATLRGIQQFQLGQAGGIGLAASRTAEFNELNEFLVRMTARAQRDYQGLQEFSENASHELQTPLASIKARIELLMDTPLSEPQLLLLTGMHDELERLARINHSLTLLAKLEHFERRPEAVADFSRLVPGTGAAFADLAELKGLTLHQAVAPGVHVALDESLAQLLLNNLFSNAIRHNVPDGDIRVELSDTALLLRNTGLAPSAPVAELFGRFKKGNPALDSIGIGLAIVKRITELYGHRITYSYAAGWHTMRVDFAPAA